MQQGEIAAQVGEQRFAIARFGFSTLLVFHNVVPDLPVRCRHVDIDGLKSTQATFRIHLRDTTEKCLI